MHDAFEVLSVLDKLPLHIESIATWESSLFVGTREGVLLVYSIKEGSGEHRFDVELKRPIKSFAKKPIVQLGVVGELGVLLSLSDGVISVHDLETFVPRAQLGKSRGANCFALQVRPAGTGKGQQVLLCVSVKRKLELLQWKDGGFVDYMSDLNLPDTAKVVMWSGDSICVGFKKEYTMVKVSGGALTELFPTGSKHDPTIVSLGHGELALGKDEMSICINKDGKPTQKQALMWSDGPIALERVKPYVVGILPKIVEVRTLEPRMLVQNFELPRARLIAHGRDVYIAAEQCVWRLQPVALVTQINQLVQDKQFELALNLAKRIREPKKENRQRLSEIRYLQAFHLFTQHRFEDSLAIYKEQSTDVVQVIGLFPKLLPMEFRKKLEYPAPPPMLSGTELEKGLSALADYLTQKRNQLSKQSKEQPTTEEERRAQEVVMQQWQIIDTTLLKCYLSVNDALVGPLLRLKDNCCHLAESERVLQSKEKFEDLVQLYQNKEQHKKALDLLQKNAQKQTGPLRGQQPTIHYLQKLGPNHLQLIFEYSKWILKAHPEDGLRIFTDDIPEVESLPRDQVLTHLEGNAKSLVMPYLEHIIESCGETEAIFHNRLVTLYREKVEPLVTKTEQGSGTPVRAGQEAGTLGKVRGKLLAFLEQSQYYVPAKLIVHFPNDKLFEERALLLGRMHRHDEALAIYTHVLKDTEQAAEYCRRNYNKDDEHSRDVYLCLLRMYLQPPLASNLGVSGVAMPQPNVKAAMEVLLEYYENIDTAKALEILPPDIPISEIQSFLCHVITQQTMRRRHQQVMKSLLLSENLQVQQQRIALQSRRCIITSDVACQACNKRIGQSAFARYPNGTVEHYYCFQKSTKS